MYVNKYLNALLNCFAKRANKEPAEVTGKRNANAKKSHTLLARGRLQRANPESYLLGSLSWARLFFSSVLSSYQRRKSK